MRPTNCQKGRAVFWAVAATFAAQACSAVPANRAAALPVSSSAATDAATQVVVLGDSLATTNARRGCVGFPELYEYALARRTGSNAGVAYYAVPDTGTADLSRQVRHDAATRQVLAGADVVVMIGFNGTPCRGDDPCHAAPDFPVVLWDQITDECIAEVTEDYAESLEAVLSRWTN